MKKIALMTIIKECQTNFKKWEDNKLNEIVDGDDEEWLNKLKKLDINSNDQEEATIKKVRDYQEIKLKNLIVSDHQDCLKNFKNALNVDDDEWLKEFKKLAIVGSDQEEVLLKNAKEIVDADVQENAITKNVGLCDPGPVPDASELAALASEIDESFLENILQDLSNVLDMDNLSTDLPARKN